jgi:putative nucleotidyltransferase with HDIG domain
MSTTMEQAKAILHKHVREESLRKHCLAVSAAMGAMAEYFGEDKEHWQAVGYLHDVDYEQYPEEHCLHVREMLEPEGVSEEDIRAIISHGYDLTTQECEPQSNMEKSLYTVDELTGIVQALGLMRPDGLDGLTVKSLRKKFKDLRFAAKCNREVIQKGCDMLGLDLAVVMEQTIKGMQEYKEELGF